MTEKEILTRLSPGTPTGIRVFPSLPSTNTTLREWASEGAPHGAAVIAEGQTAGRGRLGRAFSSPAGAGLYISLLVRRDLPLEALPLLTPYAAVAAARAIERVAKVEVGIKWVNDLRIGDLKIGGILTEGSLTPGGALDFAIVGIGINLLPGALPPELSGIAAAIGDYTTPPAPEDLAAALLDGFYQGLADFSTGGFMQEYRRRSVVLGRHLEAFDASRHYFGIATAIEDDGALRLSTPEGDLLLRAGEVSIRM